MLIDSNKTRYSTKFKLSSSLIDKMNNNNILKEYSSIKSRNDTCSINFKTIIFKKTCKERQKENNSKYNNTCILKANDLANESKTNNEINTHKSILNNKFSFTPITKRKSDDKPKNKIKDDINNINNNTRAKNNFKFKLQRNNNNYSDSLSLNMNLLKENILNLKNKNITSSSIMHENNSLKIQPKKHKKSFSAAINQINSVMSDRELTLNKKLPNLKQNYNLNLPSQSILKRNIIDLKRQLYNKYYSIQQAIKDKRISAEKEKTKLKLKIVNYSDKNTNNRIIINQKKFLSTDYLKSIVEKAKMT